jgi:hypothetical protein
MQVKRIVPKTKTGVNFLVDLRESVCMSLFVQSQPL